MINSKFKYLLFIPILIVIAIFGLSYKKANPTPYPDSKPDSAVPTYTEISIPHKHNYNGKKFLPVIGSAAIDINNDGISEVFLGGGENQDDQLYKYTKTGFEAISATPFGKSADDATYGATVADMNNDGRDDLIIARESGGYLCMNNNGKFDCQKLKLNLNEKSRSLSFSLGDINSDGHIDLYVNAYLTRSAMQGQNIFRQGYGASSVMLLNNGDNTFTDITKKSGLDFVHNAFSGIFVDMDDDFDLDLVVAHDTGRVNIWENNSGLTFTQVKTPYSDVYGYPMGIGAGDYNNDGKIDFYFSNIGPTAPKFLARGDLEKDQVLYTGLMLMENQGNMSFRDSSKKTKLSNYEFSWGVTMADLNLDGLQDILISENYVEFPLEKIFKLPGRMLLQNKDNTFASVESEAGVINENYEIAPLLADFNGDGFLDQIRVNLAGMSKAFISDGNINNNYLKVKISSTAELFGSKVEVVLDNGESLYDWHISGEGLCSDQEHTLIFGLGKERTAHKINVTLPTGLVIERSITSEQKLIVITGSKI